MITAIRIFLFTLGVALILASTLYGADFSVYGRTPHKFGYLGDRTLTAKERAQLRADEAGVNEILQSSCFEDYFLRKRSKLLRTNGRSRAEVVAHIRKSLPTVMVTYYRKSNNVHGYRNTRSKTCGEKCANTIHLNRYFTDSKKWAEGCPRMGLKGHETLHVLGYGHDYKATKDRPYSVPYSFNAMMNECCPKWLKGTLK